MNRSIYFVVLVATIAIARSESNLGNSVQIVENINEFISKNSNVVLTPLKRQPGYRIHYTLGYHVAGDRIVGQTSNSFNYPVPRFVQVKLWYPLYGTGDIVSFVDIWVDQSSDKSNAFVAQGGIGQRQIAIIIEARETTFLNYTATIFGY